MTDKTTDMHAAYFHGGPWHQRLEVRPGKPPLEVRVECIKPLVFSEMKADQPIGYVHSYRRAAPALETMMADFAVAVCNTSPGGKVTIYLHQEDAANARP